MNHIKMTIITQKKKKKKSVWNVPTTSVGVKESYPEPPDAKLTPVKRSLGCKVGSLYAGRSSLIPNSSTAHTQK